VSTIQAEQNIVIRYKPDRPLIVQGVAGSGKTTIALHRIAYLLYAYQDQMQPRNMMILAPNPLFLDYISAVLPDLGVEQVVQTTFPMLVARWLGKQMPKVQETHRLEDMLAMDAQARDAKAATLRFQGSLRFGRLLQAFLTDLEKHVVPEGDVMFGPATLYTHAQMQQIFQVELQPFPIKQRMAEIPKYIKRRLRQAQAQVLHWLETECAKRAEALADAMPDGPERRERMTRLYDSRDARCKETEARAKTFTKDYLSQWPTLDLLEVYRAFWSLLWPAELEEAERTLFEALAAQTLPLLEKKRISTGDMAPLAFLQRFIGGISRMDIRHSVIDEAQDFSPLQFQLLREVMGNPSFTIVGDLMQGVHAYEGLHAWQEILQPVFGEDAQMHFLRTSYRNTVEIMHFASRVPICHPVPGQMLARPVLRHGPEPELIACVSTKERNERVAAQTAALLAEGFHTIAILAKREEDCKEMIRALPASLSARLLRAEDSSYQGGVLVMSAVLVKGLEFDAVIMADVGEAQFADELLDARLLYVCLTRPLHRLTCYYLGACTKLLSQAEGSKPAAES
ncbi:MAG: AAA family ATPase, partial [Clostridia bacterium]